MDTAVELVGKGVIVIGLLIFVWGSAGLMRYAIQMRRPSSRTMFAGYFGGGATILGAGIVVSAAMWPETIVLGVPFMVLGIYVISRSRDHLQA